MVMESLDKLEKLVGEVIWSHSHSESPEYNECDTAICNWCVESQRHIKDIRVNIDKLEWTKAGVNDIYDRIKTLQPEEFRTILTDALNRLNSYNFSTSDDINAYQTLKQTVAMLLTWDEYWDMVKIANNI